MKYIGRTVSGGRLYRAPHITVADAFARAHGGRVEFGVILHKWYVIV